MSSLLSFLWLVSVIMHGRFVNRCVVQQCILIFLWKFIRHGKTVGCFLYTCLMSDCELIIYSICQRTVKSWGYDIGLWYNSKRKGPKKVSSLQQDQHWAQTSFSQGFLKLGLKDSNDGACTPSLGILLCCLAVLIENLFLPRSSLKLFFQLTPIVFNMPYNNAENLALLSCDFLLGFRSCCQVIHKAISHPGWTSYGLSTWRAGKVLQTQTSGWPPVILTPIYLVYWRD